MLRQHLVREALHALLDDGDASQYAELLPPLKARVVARLPFQSLPAEMHNRLLATIEAYETSFVLLTMHHCELNLRRLHAILTSSRRLVYLDLSFSRGLVEAGALSSSCPMLQVRSRLRWLFVCFVCLFRLFVSFVDPGRQEGVVVLYKPPP